MNYDTIKQLAKDQGISIKDLCALAPNNDPFYVGRDAEIKAANWFASLWQRFGYTTGVHLRRVHYQLVSQNPPLLRPNGKVYGNTKKDWSYLCSGGKYARYLGLLNPEAFEDRKNPDPIVNTRWKNEDDWGYKDPAPGYKVSDEDDTEYYVLPELPELGALPDELPELPGFTVKGYADDWDSFVQQPYHIEVWVEKTTMNDVLIPLCKRCGVNLVTGAGELSITAVVAFMDRVSQAKRPARILYISDYDPAGLGMPISIARKIEFFQSQNGGEAPDIRLQPIMLTAEQVREYNLPRTPVKDTDKRKAGWEEGHGEGQVELDALEALYPGKLAKIVENAILNYYDPDLGRRVKRQKERLVARLTDEREGVLSGYVPDIEDIAADYAELIDKMADLQERFAALVEPFQVEIEAHRGDLDGIKERWQRLVEDAVEDLEAVEVDLDDYPLPEPDLPEESDGLLYDSGRDYSTQLTYYQQYREDGYLED